jgi:Prophage CP4-57 regulatory protein (AlpA)
MMTTDNTDLLEMMMLRFADLKAGRIVNDRKTLKTWMERPDDPFPAPYALSERSLAWKKTEVEAWLARRRQKRGA